MAALSLPGAQGVPLFSYSKKTFTCAGNVANVPGSVSPGSTSQGPGGNIPVRGNFVSATINVIVPDTTANVSVSVNPWGPFSGYAITDQTTGAVSTTNDGVNLKIAGTRVISTGAPTGGQSGDSLHSYNNKWIMTIQNGGGGDVSVGMAPSNYDVNSNTTPATACAVWTIELVTSR
jgi:hypothetical protein